MHGIDQVTFVIKGIFLLFIILVWAAIAYVCFNYFFLPLNLT